MMKTIVPVLLLIICLVLLSNTAKAQEITYDTAWTNQYNRTFNAALDANDLPEANRLIAAADSIIAVKYGPRSLEASDLIEWKCNLSQFIGEYEGMDSLTKLCLEIRTKNLGYWHPKVVMALLQAGYIKQVNSGYSKAVEDIYLQAMEIVDSLHLKYSDEGLNTLNNMAIYYNGKGNYDKAERYYREALDSEQKMHGTTRLEYSVLTNNLGVLYSSMDRLRDAIHYTEASLLSIEKITGKVHPEYSSRLRTLGALYRRLGRLDKAEQVTSEAIDIARKVLPEGSPEFVYYLWTMADYYYSLGQFQAMKPYLDEAFSLIADKAKLPSPIMMTAYLEWALYYEGLRDYDKALEYYAAQVEALEKAGQTNGLAYARAAMAVSRVLYHLKREEEGHDLAEKSIAAAEKVLGAQSPVFYRRFLQALFGFWEKPLYHERILEVWRNGARILTDNYGAESYVCAEWDFYGARIWELAGQTDSTIFLSKRGFAIFEKIIQRDFSFMSFAQKESYLSNFTRFTQIMSRLGNRHPNYQGMGSFLYDMVLFWKDLLIANNAALVRIWQQNDNPAIRNELREYYSLRQEAAAEAARPLTQQRRLQGLQDSIQVIEKKLLAATGESSLSTTFEAVTWQQIQRTLRPGEAAIEFILLGGNDTIPKRYGALLLLSGKEAPELILLGETDDIDSVMGQAGGRPFTYAEKIYGNSGRKLYNLIWKPLEPRLEKVNKIYLAPAGRLYQLNFRALPAAQPGKYLADTKALVCLTTTRQLTDPDFNKPTTIDGQAFLLGGVDFDDSDNSTTTTPTVPDLEQEVNLSNLNVKLEGQQERGGYRRKWEALPETLVEVTTIDSLLRTRKIPVKLVTGKNGTEATLKENCSAAHSPIIVHIASHGFFYSRQQPDSEKDNAQPGLLFSENPMLRSGLVLAGANPAWQGQPRPNSVEDGILTAEEVSFLNLSKAQLVVLSACETGLGEIRDYEGVYGLQRAFRVAGAKNLVMTLWRVPDQTTREFMVDFYNRLIKGAEVRTAFNSAVAALRQKYPAPYYWAGFILVDGTR